MEFSEIVPLIVTVILAIAGAVSGAVLTVRIAIAEIKKDISHVQEKQHAENENKDKVELEHSNNMKEVRNDVKEIFKTLTKIQITIAQTQGRDEVLSTIKGTLTQILKGKE
jgi:CRISPR/Cas system CSM-associated protein Csm2 small subunit